MRLGVSIAQTGRLADPVSVRSAATAAEQVGYSSVWVFDRLEGADATGAGVPRSPDLPPDLMRVLDPLSVLTFAAAVTARVRLGTSVLVAPWYRPALLARSLTALDVLSDGRLTVGLGLGGSLDGLAATGVPQQELGRRLDDALDMLDAVWGGNGAAAGARPTRVGPAPAPALPGPVQRPRPPVLLSSTTPEGLERVARRADGWTPAGLPADVLAPMWASLRDLAAGHGRDPDALELVVRADLAVTDRPVEGDRPPYHGTVEQVAADIVDTRRAGADEVILGMVGDHALDDALDVYARIAEAVDLGAAA